MTMTSSAAQEIDDRQLSHRKFFRHPECDRYLPRGCFRGHLRGPFRGHRSRILTDMALCDDLGRGGWTTSARQRNRRNLPPRRFSRRTARRSSLHTEVRLGTAFERLTWASTFASTPRAQGYQRVPIGGRCEKGGPGARGRDAEKRDSRPHRRRHGGAVARSRGALRTSSRLRRPDRVRKGRPLRSFRSRYRPRLDRAAASPARVRSDESERSIPGD